MCSSSPFISIPNMSFSLLEAIPIAACVSKDDRLIYFNRSAIQLLNPCSEGITNQLQHTIIEAIRLQQPLYTFFFAPLLKWLNLRVSQFVELSCHIVTIEDVTVYKSISQLVEIGRCIPRNALNNTSDVFLNSICHTVLENNIACASLFDMYDQDRNLVREFSFF